MLRSELSARRQFAGCVCTGLALGRPVVDRSTLPFGRADGSGVGRGSGEPGVCSLNSTVAFSAAENKDGRNNQCRFGVHLHDDSPLVMANGRNGFVRRGERDAIAV
jgi:hypothetical protein